MRIGPLEIVLIVVVVIAVALVVRIARLGRIAIPGSQKRPPARRRGWYYRSGVALIIAGVVVFTAAASLFRWALQGYLWALLLIAGGAGLLLLARRKG